MAVLYTGLDRRGGGGVSTGLGVLGRGATVGVLRRGGGVALLLGLLLGVLLVLALALLVLGGVSMLRLESLLTVPGVGAVAG